MGKITEVPIRERRALNQVLIYSSHAPSQAAQEPAMLIRGLRSALRMSQSQLARRCGLPRAHIGRLENGKIDIQLSTLRRLLDAMFCDLILLPRARKRPSDAIWERQREGKWAQGRYRRRIWDE